MHNLHQRGATSEVEMQSEVISVPDVFFVRQLSSRIKLTAARYTAYTFDGFIEECLVQHEVT
jgi:hypothetical protein